ncbi:TPA: hypothetical protein L9K43_004984 [Klebsiella pneumoniae]|nr:hypothetical protein [Klebsiella pneumoniae]
MVPSVVQRLERLGASAVFERGAGTAATFDDGAYSHASFAETPEALVADADIVLAVQPPPAVVAGTMKAGAVLISFVYGQANRELVATLRAAMDVDGPAVVAIPVDYRDNPLLMGQLHLSQIL